MRIYTFFFIYFNFIPIVAKVQCLDLMPIAYKEWLYKRKIYTFFLR